ncbi:hypothetical protein ABIB96_001249 [Bradyrhizobium sp. LA3.X]|uniref:hypothetical protein n=1 Tax=unclassified Bradyrhizobium TaxID=2631580 RepID=UPI003390A748
MTETPRFVRCRDNTLQRDVLTVGEVYEVSGEQYDNYRVCGRWMTKRRFEPVNAEDAT